MNGGWRMGGNGEKEKEMVKRWRNRSWYGRWLTVGFSKSGVQIARTRRTKVCGARRLKRGGVGTGYYSLVRTRRSFYMEDIDSQSFQTRLALDRQASSQRGHFVYWCLMLSLSRIWSWLDDWCTWYIRSPFFRNSSQQSFRFCTRSILWLLTPNGPCTIRAGKRISEDSIQAKDVATPFSRGGPIPPSIRRISGCLLRHPIRPNPST